jgi:hypothetical protein
MIVIIMLIRLSDHEYGVSLHVYSVLCFFIDVFNIPYIIVNRDQLSFRVMLYYSKDDCLSIGKLVTVELGHDWPTVTVLI